MISTSNITLTIGFNKKLLDPEECDQEALRLISELRNLNEIEKVDLVTELNPLELSKSIGSFVIGLLTAEVSPKNVDSIFRFLSNRLSGKPIELEVEKDGKKLKVIANNREELKAAIKAAQDFISSSN